MKLMKGIFYLRLIRFCVVRFMYQAADFFNQVVFVSVTFPGFACKSDDSEINIV